jgi:hypothetical protein
MGCILFSDMKDKIWARYLISIEYCRLISKYVTKRVRKSVEVARVAQWLERWAQRSDDPCVGRSNPTAGHGCSSFG